MWWFRATALNNNQLWNTILVLQALDRECLWLVCLFWEHYYFPVYLFFYPYSGFYNLLECERIAPNANSWLTIEVRSRWSLGETAYSVCLAVLITCFVICENPYEVANLLHFYCVVCLELSVESFVLLLIQASLLISTVCDKFLKMIGKGSYGAVYKARDLKTSELVAIKVISLSEGVYYLSCVFSTSYMFFSYSCATIFPVPGIIWCWEGLHDTYL